MKDGRCTPGQRSPTRARIETVRPVLHGNDTTPQKTSKENEDLVAG